MTTEIAIQRFRQIVEHKKEMVERAKEYAAVQAFTADFDATASALTNKPQ